MLTEYFVFLNEPQFPDKQQEVDITSLRLPQPDDSLDGGGSGVIGKTGNVPVMGGSTLAASAAPSVAASMSTQAVIAARSQQQV